MIFKKKTEVVKEKKNLTASEQQLRNKLKDTAIFLKEVVTVPEVMKEIEFAVRHNTDELDRDERVKFKELLDENAAYKKALKKQKTKVAEANSFAKLFRQQAKSLSKRKTLFKSGENLEEFLKREDIVVYWPYSEYFHDDIKTPTLTYDPIDNEQVNEGFEPVILSPNAQQKGSSETWKTVTVDDGYAQKSNFDHQAKLC